jgi:ferredoxin-NADP reductase
LVRSEGTVADVIVETDDATTLRVRMEPPIVFLAGQYFNLRLRVPGQAQPVIRTYSAASSPFPIAQTIDLTVKEAPGGLVSPVLVRETRVGTPVDLDGPFGNFTWEESDEGPLLLVAAGSGIVPLMSIIRYEEARQLTVPTTLLYANRDRAHVIFDAELTRIDRRCRWLSVLHALSLDTSDRLAAYHRHVDQSMLEEVAGRARASLLAYVCGPPTFVHSVETMLIAIGVNPSRIRAEEWA